MSSQPPDENRFGEWGRLPRREVLPDAALGNTSTIEEWGSPPLNLKKSLTERFMDKIIEDGEHWIWQGATNRGYGTMTIDSKIKYAHRVSYELFKGSIPEGHRMQACEIKLCVNPSHLSTASVKIPTIIG